SARVQPGNHICRWRCLEHYPEAGLHPEAGRVHGCLWIAAQVDQLRHHLDMALCLHIAPHDAEAGKWLALTCDECRNDGVHRALARGDLVSVPRLERKATSPIMQCYASAGNHHTRPEALVIGLNE